MDCRRCGTCCVAPDISTLGKPAGEPCPHLGDDLRCRIYPIRPPVCRGYTPDETCRQLTAPGLAERVALYRRMFGV